GPGGGPRGFDPRPPCRPVFSRLAADASGHATNGSRSGWHRQGPAPWPVRRIGTTDPVVAVVRRSPHASDPPGHGLAGPARSRRPGPWSAALHRSPPPYPLSVGIAPRRQPSRRGPSAPVPARGDRIVQGADVKERYRTPPPFDARAPAVGAAVALVLVLLASGVLALAVYLTALHEYQLEA